jgi:BirA family biotin operon repressor/biotin-[acetyl-CoA-carboxylase] ligase
MTDITHIWRIKKMDSVTSTNDEARRGAESNEREGLVVWALQQTTGRGRYGRTWESPEGNLYVSILLRPGCDLKHVPRFGFIAALTVHDTVHALLPDANVTLKWPNDVLVNGKKISGVLLEASAAPNQRVLWAIVGIGLNVEHHPDNPSYPATSLEAEGTPSTELEEILDTLLDRFYYWKKLNEEEGFEPIRNAWLTAAQKGRLSVRLPQETVEGEFAALDDNGALVLRLADGSKKVIAAGDVFLTN